MAAALQCAFTVHGEIKYGSTDVVLHFNPLLVSSNQLFDDILFDLFFGILLQIDAYP